MPLNNGQIFWIPEMQKWQLSRTLLGAVVWFIIVCKVLKLLLQPGAFSSLEPSCGHFPAGEGRGGRRGGGQKQWGGGGVEGRPQPRGPRGPARALGGAKLLPEHGVARAAVPEEGAHRLFRGTVRRRHGGHVRFPLHRGAREEVGPGPGRPTSLAVGSLGCVERRARGGWRPLPRRPAP